MAERKALRKRALPALLVAGFALLALGKVAIHQQGRQSELLLTQSRRAMLRLKMDDFFALLKPEHPVRDESRWHAVPMPGGSNQNGSEEPIVFGQLSYLVPSKSSFSGTK